MTLSLRAFDTRADNPVCLSVAITWNPLPFGGHVPSRTREFAAVIIADNGAGRGDQGQQFVMLAPCLQQGSSTSRRGSVSRTTQEDSMSDDHSPGDGRAPYSDIGGTDARHAQTHDVRREQLTNPKGPEPVDTSFDDDLAEQTPQRVREQHLDAQGGDTDKRVGQLLPELTNDQLSRLSILEPGTPLEQGAVYLDLNNRDSGPFKAIGGQKVGDKDRIIAKKQTDFEMWNEVAGRADDATVERPDTSS
jgi:hypothetical protein